MIFFALFAFILAVQLLHWHVLRRIAPDALRPWLPWILLVLHLPLILFFAMRFTGNTTHGFGHALRPFARIGFYFQAFTAMHLAILAAAECLWWWRARHQLPPIETEAEAEVEGHDPVRRAFLRKVAVSGFGAATAGVTFGASRAYFEPSITRLTLAFDDLPREFDGLRIVQLSDLHVGPLIGPSSVERWRRLTLRERPDLLLLTGDIVDTLPEEAGPFLAAFRDVPAPSGRFAILGNHDYFTDPVPLWNNLKASGWHCLENANALVERGSACLAIMGLQDPQATNGRFRGIRFGPGPSWISASRDIPEHAWKLCLSHRPDDWNLARLGGARLTLSGHTHGGQINLFPGLNTARLLGPYTRGEYREGRDLLYVSRGLGVVALPLRIGADPELVVITLKRG
ncbi:MAG: metallophosphoesterase [Holophagaceae bacterium]|nr:metallophosphoesterase [Holophagaceae bacterium]